MCDLEAEAIFWNGRSFSWDLIDAYVHSTSRRLKEIGIGCGSHVLVEAHPRAGTIIVFLSLWRIGAIVCPFDPRCPLPMAQSIQNICNPVLFLSGDLSAKFFVNLRSFPIDDVVCIEPVERFMAQARVVANPSLDRQQTAAAVIFTSGSTGVPKAVTLTFKALMANARGAASIIPFKKGDRWLLALPLYRISGLAVIFRALLGHGCMILMDKNTVTIESAIIRYKPSHISLVPAQFLRLVQSLPQEAWNVFKAILIGGAPIPERLMDIAQQRQLLVFLTYGMTETGSQIATGPIDEVRRCGARVLPGREVMTKDGEIYVRGDVMATGYSDNANIVDICDKEGWFHTGDLGETDGIYLSIHGRRDRMFISGGENVYPEIIEKALLNFEGVSSARVGAVEHEIFGKVPEAQIILKDGVSVDEGFIRNELKKTLLPFQIPKSIIMVDFNKSLSQDEWKAYQKEA